MLTTQECSRHVLQSAAPDEKRNNSNVAKYLHSHFCKATRYHPCYPKLVTLYTQGDSDVTLFYIYAS